MNKNTKQHFENILLALLGLLRDAEDSPEHVNHVLPTPAPSAEPLTGEPTTDKPKRHRRTAAQIAADEAAEKAAAEAAAGITPEAIAEVKAVSEAQAPATTLFPDKSDEELYNERRAIFDPKDPSKFNFVKKIGGAKVKEILGRFGGASGNRDIKREDHAAAVAELTALVKEGEEAHIAASL